MSQLVQKLSDGEHPVELSIRPARTVAALKECIERGYVHVKFTDTIGGTELGVDIDRERSRIGEALDEGARGTITLVGELTLDYVDVRCVATIDLETLTGSGHLERLPHE